MKDKNNLILIAEFMGLPYDADTKEYQFKNMYAGFGVMWVHEEELMFNKSWDWIMPVIEKCAIGEGEFDQLKSEQLGEVYDKLLNFDLPGTHKTVVEFIKFYNQNK
tara:strand:- start:3860 stop:4177 length:318 start_codon:yes stop_codon:yes gene_type:complete